MSRGAQILLCCFGFGFPLPSWVRCFFPVTPFTASRWQWLLWVSDPATPTYLGWEHCMERVGMRLSNDIPYPQDLVQDLAHMFPVKLLITAFKQSADEYSSLGYQSPVGETQMGFWFPSFGLVQLWILMAFES